MISRYLPKSRFVAAAGVISSLITTIVGFGIMIPKYGTLGVAFTAGAGLFAAYYGCTFFMKKEVKANPTTES